jgi:DNA-binding transcriptional LysR family regulator
MAIRLGKPPESYLVARKLEDAKVGVYASSAYLRRCGSPLSLDDLGGKSHTLLPFILPSTGRMMPWLFMLERQALEWQPKSQLRVSEDQMGNIALARAGMGLVQTFDWIGSAHGSELQEVLAPFAGRSKPFYILYPQNRQLSARVRVLVDFLVNSERDIG